MSNRLLIRPSVQRGRSNYNSDFLPADLAAAYACYHDNMVEQRKLELTLRGIDIETKQMKRDIRQRKEVLERELKEKEDDYWSCHRVFSAATLITESDSYRKRLYTGPRPTKAKLPRRTLERLSRLVRKLQAEDDLEDLLRFQRCARYARRIEDCPKSAMSLTFDRESDITEEDSSISERFTELMNAPSMDRVESIGSDSSGRVKRIQSAPLRIASEKEAQKLRNNRGHSAFPKQPSMKAQDETCRYSKEGSQIVLCSNDRERYIKMAWTEGVPDTENEVVERNESGNSVSAVDQSYDESLVLKEKSQWQAQNGVEQSRDIESLALFSPEQRSLESSKTDIFDLSHSQHLRPESRSEHLQFRNATPTRKEVIIDSDLFTKEGSTASCTFEGDARGNKVEDRFQPRGLIHRSKHDEVPVSASKEIKPSESDLSSPLQNMESTSEVSDEDQRLCERDTLQLEPGEQYTFRIRAESQYSETEKFDLTRGKEVDRNDFEVAVYRRETQDIKTAKAQNSRASITLPKSSLHGLSSRRKSLVPRSHHKQSKQHISGFTKVKNTRGGKPDLPVASDAERPSHKALPSDEVKRRQEERQPNAPRKRKVSIFKRKCLSDVLFSEQVEVESRLRNRVQGFLGLTGLMEDEEIGEEKLE